MCSVMEVCRMLRNVEKVQIGWYANVFYFDPNDTVQMKAYGNFAVDEIEISEGGTANIIVSVSPNMAD